MKVEAQTTLPAIKTNFDVAKKQVQEDLLKYENYVVTIDTLADDKKLAQSIKSQGKEINDLRLATKKELTAPIIEFETQANELKDLYLSAASKISDQVSSFEKVTLDKLRNDLIDILMTDFEKLGVTSQFQINDVDHLVKLTNITAKGQPTKKAKGGVLAIGQSCFVEQCQYNDRIMQAENKSLRDGLSSPLQEIHIKSFIFSSEGEFEEKLDELIAVELQRQEETQSKVKPVEQPPASKVLDLPKSDVFEGVSTQEPVNIQPTVIDGKIEYICTATFKVTVPQEISVDKIERKLVKMIEDSGITSLQAVEVKPNGV